MFLKEIPNINKYVHSHQYKKEFTNINFSILKLFKN